MQWLPAYTSRNCTDLIIFEAANDLHTLLKKQLGLICIFYADIIVKFAGHCYLQGSLSGLTYVNMFSQLHGLM